MFRVFKVWIKFSCVGDRFMLAEVHEHGSSDYWTSRNKCHSVTVKQQFFEILWANKTLVRMNSSHVYYRLIRSQDIRSIIVEPSGWIFVELPAARCSPDRLNSPQQMDSIDPWTHVKLLSRAKLRANIPLQLAARNCFNGQVRSESHQETN